MFLRAIFLICLLFINGIVFGGNPRKTANIPKSAPDKKLSLAVKELDHYRINPFDLLEISVFDESDLKKTVRVSQYGYISFPLVGNIKVAGLDVISAEKKIAKLLRKGYLVNPYVNVFINEYSIKKVFVMGEVTNPGVYDIPRDHNLSVVEAISLAGGFTKTASIDRTKIIRAENGEKKYIEVKMSDITKRGDKAKDLILKPYDIVYVPERIF